MAFFYMHNTRSKYWLVLFLELVLVGVITTVLLIRFISARQISPKEVESLRNYTSKTVEASDGIMTTTFYQNPINYKNEKGKFENIDVRIKKSTLKRYQYQNITNVVKSYFKDTSDGEFIRLETEGSVLYYSLSDIPGVGAPKKVPVVVSDSQIVYPNVYEGIDIVYIVDVSQNKIFFRLNNKETALNITEIPLIIRTENASFNQDASGPILIQNEKGIIAKINNPFLIEQKDLQDKNNNPNFVPITYTLDSKDNIVKLSKVLGTDAQSWLGESTRRYPVLIDPITIFFPDADPETSSVDGYIDRFVNESTFPALRAAASGTSANTTSTSIITEVRTDTLSNTFDQFRRGYLGFDLSAISPSANIMDAKLNMYFTSKTMTLGSGAQQDFIVVQSSPATNTNLVTGDYDSLGTTAFYRTGQADITTSAYNNLTLNPAGKAFVTSMIGSTAFFGVQVGADLDNSEPTWVTVKEISYAISSADVSGITQDPMLIVSWRMDATAHLKVDEGTGTTTGDSSYLGTHTGTFTGAPVWQTEDKCVQGKCLFFDGSDDAVAVAQESSINMYQSASLTKDGYSVCGWIKPLSDGEVDVGEFWSKGSSYLRVEQESGGAVKVKALFDLATTDAAYTTTRTISTSDWTHVCATYADDSDDEITIYLNGKAEGTSSSIGDGSPTDDSASAGALGGDSTNNFHGYIDEFKIFPFELTAAQVRSEALPNASTNGSSAALGGKIDQGDFLSKGLVGYWKLDETSGNASDSSGKATILTASTTDVAWYNASWPYRKKVTIDNTKVDADLTNFPVYFTETTDTELGGFAQDDGDDILFTNSSGTKLDHDLVSFNGTTGAIVAWVEVNSVANSTDTPIYMYYGNLGASAQEAVTATWGNSYAGVWHLEEASGNVSDSTSNGFTGTNANTTTIAGQIGSGRDFNGTTASIDYGTLSGVDFSTNYTVEIWAKFDAMGDAASNCGNFRAALWSKEVSSGKTMGFQQYGTGSAAAGTGRERGTGSQRERRYRTGRRRGD